MNSFHRAFMVPLLMAPAAVWGATLPSVDESPVGRTHPADAAVVVGNEDYAYLQDVPYASRDAQAFRDWVVRGRGVPDSRVRLLVNASHASMRDAIGAAAAEVQSGGILWIYFAGHGAGATRSDGTTERSLVGKSAEADANTLKDFVIRLSDIESIVAGSKASQIVVVLDACYANADRSGNPLLGGRYVVPDYAATPAPRVALWTGASSTEVAEGYDAAQHGLFTYFALAALQGQADGVNGTTDGEVSLDEAATWTSQAVRIVGEYRQNPMLTTDAANRTTILGSVAPGLIPINPSTLPKSKAASGASSLKSDLERLRREQEAARTEEARLNAERDSRTAEARRTLLSEASQAWRDVLALTREPGDAAEFAVRRYLEVYEGSTITVDGISQAVEVPEVEQAQALLQDLERKSRKKSAPERTPEKSPERVPKEKVAAADAQPFPWLLTTGGIVGLAGGGLIVWGGAQERAFMAGDPSGWTLEEAHERQSSVNTVYLVGYAALSAGAAMGFLGLVDVTPVFTVGEGGPVWSLSRRW